LTVLAVEEGAVSEGSRRELADFLRSRRARITPDDVGLPAGSRRRSPGLRREDVAVLSGLSPTWYTYLEQGRDIHPSAQVLDSLARVLLLTEDERRYLHVLAGGSVAAPRPIEGELTAEELVRELVSTAQDSPYPVFGTNVYCDVIAWNPAATAYYTDWGRVPPDRRNLMRWLLESPEAKERFVDWSEETRDIVAGWRAATVALDGDGRLHALLEEFKQLSSEFERWWGEHDVRQPRSRLVRFLHPRHGERSLRLITVRAPDFAPCRVAFHVPVRPA
jgi:transcriptional regulator with XRE-family HTH domain